MAKSKFRGNKIKFVNNMWIFSSSGNSVQKTWGIVACGCCGVDFTNEGHDGCIGNLPFVMNACCGHGELEEMFVQFSKRLIFTGFPAKIIIRLLKKYDKITRRK